METLYTHCARVFIFASQQGYDTHFRIIVMITVTSSGSVPAPFSSAFCRVPSSRPSSLAFPSEKRAAEKRGRKLYCSWRALCSWSFTGSPLLTRDARSPERRRRRRGWAGLRGGGGERAAEGAFTVAAVLVYHVTRWWDGEATAAAFTKF